MIRQSVPEELKKRTIKLTIVQEKEKVNSTKFKYLVKKKSKCTDGSSGDKDK